MTLLLSRRAALGASAALATPLVATAQGTPVRFSIDWIFHGAYSYAAVADRRGFFRDAGVNATVSRGFGSARVPIDISAGTVDIATCDPTPLMRFMSMTPDNDLLCVGLVWDQPPHAATVRADGPIRTFRDLAGKTLAAPEFDGGRQVFPVAARLNGLDPASINWLSVSPELREPMLVQRRADGITGFVTSSIISLKALGLDIPQQRIFRYRELGLDFFYGFVIVTTRTFARNNPEAVRGSVAAILRSVKYGFHNRAEAIQSLKEREPLTDVPIELARQAIAMDELVDSPNVRRLGLGTMEAPRIQRQLDAVKEAYSLAAMPSVDRFYTDSFLPPVADRAL
ncbi:ABC transporter substrate-binding protein [Rhodovarius lipocyclicus]|uniref:ABC transporter substrate-binding protein n=1 Tax=Rhodovarius lipocyclicus TaxID=268410 RepID=UPI00135A01A6|nr:ABC transporter substrate-binding protein [Rhodovarius lipocyclicus]